MKLVNLEENTPILPFPLVDLNNWNIKKTVEILPFPLVDLNNWNIKKTVEFSLNVFTEFSEFNDKIILFLKKWCTWTHYLLRERQRLYHSATETQLTEDI